MGKLYKTTSDILGTLAGLSFWGDVVGYMLDRPHLVVPYSEGWVEPKPVNTYSDREYPSSTSSYIYREYRTKDHYKVYGITIRNEKMKIGRVEAKIHRAMIQMWNSKLESIGSKYPLRLWEGRFNSTVHPLFPGNNANVDEPKVLGEGGELDLVIAYNEENTPQYYRFTTETHLEDNFLKYKDRFKDDMPHFAHIEIQAHKKNLDVFIKIENSENKNELKITVIDYDNFPLAREEFK